ncbi:MAG: phosphate signaling complex protein PhoU [Pseudomonadota bacterium]
MERGQFNEHISGQLNRNLEALFNQVLEMGGLVERQLDYLLEATNCDDRNVAKKIKQLDKIVNREEMEIDRLCAMVLARQQPRASDLRLIIISIRMAVDLERIGDEAVIASKLASRMAKKGIQCLSLPGFKGLVEIASCGVENLKKSLNAFSCLDLSEIIDIVDDQERMDLVLKQSLAEIQAAFEKAAYPPEHLMEMIYAVRACSRITDHVVNLTESVVYLVEGRDVRNMDSIKLSEFLDGVKE